MKRRPSREILDEGCVSAADRQACMDDLLRINRRWGGISGTLRLFERFFALRGPHSVRVLDVGSGDGRCAALLRERLAQRHIEASFTALDRQIENFRAGSPRDLARVAADVHAAPFPPESFDVVTCNLFLHHFSGEAAVSMLRACVALAREAVFVNDLDRRWLPYLLVRFVPWIARNSIARADGVASVRQAYTLSEIAALGAEAHSGPHEAIGLPAFRNGLILWKVESPGASERPAKAMQPRTPA